MYLSFDKIVKIAFVFAIFVLVSPLSGEKFLLKNGRIIYGEISEQNEKWVKVISRFGELTISISQIIDITQEMEPPIPIISETSPSPQNIPTTEAFRLQLVYGQMYWRGGDLKTFADRSFDFWNSVGEIEKYLGKEVEKARVPHGLDHSFKWDIKVLRRFGLFQMGISYNAFSSSFENRTVIGGTNYFDSWKLKGQRFGFVLGLAQMQKSQVTSQIELGGNFIDFDYQSETERIRASSFFLSLKTSTGYIVDLGNHISLFGEIGYILASRPKWKDLFCNEIFDETHHVTRVVFSEKHGVKPEVRMDGFVLSAGIVIKFVKTKQNKSRK